MRAAPIALAFLLLAPPAFACPGTGEVGASRDFQMGEKGWGEPDAQFRIEGEAAILTPQVGTQTARWNAGSTLANADVCITITMPESTKDASRGYAGLLFWGVDKDNFHQAVISPNGMLTVARKVGGRILATPPVGWSQTSAIDLAPGARNTLRVTIEGQRVVVRVNDAEVAHFRGQAPDGPSRVGLVASSAPGAADTWRLADFEAAEVAAPAAPGTQAAPDVTTGAIDAGPAADCGAGPMLFDDKFVDHDPMWGPKNAEVVIEGGQAELDPAPGTPTLRFNRAFVFGDLDACASVRLEKETSAPTSSYAGLLFWVQDSRNYFEAVVAPNGYFTVARVVDGKVVAKRPVAWTKTGVVKTGAKEHNALRVVAKGPVVQVYINGKPAGSFHGEPPPAPTYVGMLASSAPSKRGDTWSISGFKVTAPQ